MKMKKGLEFSTTFLVTLIIGLIMIFLAFAFFKTAMQKTQELAVNIDENTKLQIDRILTESQSRFIVPIFEQTLKRGQTYSFGAGLKNVLEDTVFTIDVQYLKTEYETGEIAQDPSNPYDFFFPDYGTHRLLQNERKIVQVPLRVPKNVEKNLKYYFLVTARCDLATSLCNPYGYPQEIIIHVV